MDQARTTAVVWFSITGHSQRVAKKLAEALNGDLIALHAPAYRPGVLGYMRAGFDSLRQKCDLAPQEFTSLEHYRHLVLCGPVWTSYPATPLRALLRSNIGLPPAVSLFLTSGGHSPAQKAFDTAEADLGRTLAATASLSNAAEQTETETDALNQFVSDVRAHGGTTLTPVS
ncbi:flavodoxin family protein [Roseobacter sinensis]|uniref:Flavodoxin-like domain-containing protein n=1 Tax=Roseobacter sinensis TaxID=2931391 RepID=A0ABT3BD49_9RHOB|nr:hypothetical protein [Roseobacter sp. WL0113]MCV3271504.1 hypothetical protein [Roseobacter sp. WL0113]